MDHTVYHIYAKDRCLYNTLTEDEFQIKWAELKAMVGIMRTEYREEDLSFVKCPAESRSGGAGGSFDDNLEPSY